MKDFRSDVRTCVVTSSPRDVTRAGAISVADVLSVQPFRNTVDVVEVSGATLLAVMEHSAAQRDEKLLSGGFLQHSGRHSHRRRVSVGHFSLV